MKLKIILLLWLAAVVLIECDDFMEKRGVQLRLEKILCDCVPTFCTVKCNVKLRSRSVANLNIAFTALKTFDYLRYHLRTFYKHSNNEYRPMLIDVQEEYCAVAAGKKPSVIQDFVLKQLGSHTNLHQTCPLKPGEYYVKDFNFAIKHIPNIIPEVRYLLNVTIYRDSNSLRDSFVAHWDICFRITNYGTLDLSVG